MVFSTMLRLHFIPKQPLFQAFSLECGGKCRVKSSWWRHQMKTFSALLAFCAVNSPHKGQRRGALMFSLICTWINSWVNNPEAGDLRRHRAHCDVSAMLKLQQLWKDHPANDRVMYIEDMICIPLYPSDVIHFIYNPYCGQTSSIRRTNSKNSLSLVKRLAWTPFTDKN